MAAPAGRAGRGLVFPEQRTGADRWAGIRASEAGLSAKIAIGPARATLLAGRSGSRGWPIGPAELARSAVGPAPLRTTILGCSLFTKRTGGPGGRDAAARRRGARRRGARRGGA